MDNKPVVTIAPEAPQKPASNERNIAVIAHLAPLAGYLVVIGQILLPLAIYIFGPSHPFVKEQAKEALNAQISFTVYWAIVLFLYVTVIGIPLAILLTVVLGIAVVWTMVSAAITTADGRPYRYPGIFRLVA